MIKLINGDCFEEMQKLIDDDIQVDLILTDPPYGTVKGMDLDGWSKSSTEWDTPLPLTPMFGLSEKLLRMNGVLILFSQEPYTSKLRQFQAFNMDFLYPYYWIKDHFANALSSKKAPVNYVEDISVFKKIWDSDNKHPLRIYAQTLLKEMGVTYKEIERKLGHRKAEHFFYRIGSSQFSLCTQPTYDELIDTYKIDELDVFKPYDELVKINELFKPKFNFNPNGKFKSNILTYSKSYNHFHPTEKPVPLLVDLVETYTDEGDTVLDFTMGSGSTGVACLQTQRNFIGIELEEKYYNIAKERCSEYQSRLI